VKVKDNACKVNRYSTVTMMAILIPISLLKFGKIIHAINEKL
jgi:hypothetical protein